MAAAWIGIIGALIGATAGLAGAYLAARMAAQQARVSQDAATQQAHDHEIREASALLVAKARYPEQIRIAQERGLIGVAELAALVTTWFEEVTVVHTKVVVLCDDEVCGAADLLWQRATDLVLAFLGDPSAGGTPSDINSELVQTAWSFQEAVALHHGHGRSHLQRGID